jgi:hypothetical protein
MLKPFTNIQEAKHYVSYAIKIVEHAINKIHEENFLLLQKDVWEPEDNAKIANSFKGY